MKYSYNSRYKTALFSFSAVVCMGGGCITKGEKSQTPQEKFKAVWQKKVKNLFSDFKMLCAELKEKLKGNTSIDQLNTLQQRIGNVADNFIKEGQEVYLTLSDKELERFADELEKSKDVLTTLVKKSPASVQEKISQLYTSCESEIESELSQIFEQDSKLIQLSLPLVSKYPNLAKMLFSNFLNNFSNIQAG